MINNIVIRDVVFDFDFQYGLELFNINGGTVSDCTFSGGRFGALSESGCVGIQHRNREINQSPPNVIGGTRIIDHSLVFGERPDLVPE